MASPLSIRAAIHAAAELHALADDASAHAVLEEARASHGDRPELLIAIGRIELDDAPAAAATAFDAALVTAPGDFDALLGLAAARARRANAAGLRARMVNRPRRRRSLRRLRRLAPALQHHDAADDLWRLSLLKELGASRLALRVAAAAAQAFPQSAPIHRRLAKLASARGHEEQAADSYRLALDVDSDDLATVESCAIALSRAGRISEARALVRGAIARAPDVAFLHTRLGLIEQESGARNSAAVAFRVAYALDPDDAENAMHRATALRALGDLTCADAVTEQAVRMHPDHLGLWIERGWIALRLHRHNRALDCFQRAREIDMTSRAAFQGRLRARLRTGAFPLRAPLAALNRTTWRHFSERHAGETVLRRTIGKSEHATQLRTRVADYVWRCARLETLEDAVPAVVGGALGIVYVTLCVSALVLLEPTHPLSSAAVVAAFFAEYTLAALLMVAGIRVLAAIDPDRPAAAATGLAFVYALAAAVVTTESTHLPTFLGYVGECALAIASAILMILVASAVLVSACFAIALRRIRKRDPLAAALGSIADLIGDLREARARGTALATSLNVHRLETAAAALQEHLRSCEPTGDQRTDEWLRGRAAGIAAAVRGLKAWVITPGPDTSKVLEARLERDIDNIAESRWSSLTWEDPVPIAAGRRRRLWMQILQNIVIAAAPLVSLLALESTGVLQLHGGTEDQAFLAAMLWAGFTLLITLDPDLMAKFVLVREAFDRVSRRSDG
jgi:tetratricopeptide (TPR) repeat protein